MSHLHNGIDRPLTALLVNHTSSGTGVGFTYVPFVASYTVRDVFERFGRPGNETGFDSGSGDAASVGMLPNLNSRGVCVTLGGGRAVGVDLALTSECGVVGVMWSLSEQCGG